MRAGGTQDCPFGMRMLVFRAPHSLLRVRRERLATLTARPRLLASGPGVAGVRRQLISAVEIDDYLQRLDEPKRSTLSGLRRDIPAVIPGAEQCISYGLPGPGGFAYRAPIRTCPQKAQSTRVPVAGIGAT